MYLIYYLHIILAQIENFIHEIDTSHRKKIGHVPIEGAHGFPGITQSEHHIHH